LSRTVGLSYLDVFGCEGHVFLGIGTGMPQNRLRNLATAVQVSIDTAVQHCEVNHSVGVGISSLIFPRSCAVGGVDYCARVCTGVRSGVRVRVHARNNHWR